MIVSYGFSQYFTIYVFMARESFADISNELPCLRDLKNLEQLPVLEVSKVTHATWLRRNVSNRFLHLENINTEEMMFIRHNHQHLRVPLKPEIYLNFRGHPNMVAQ